jgi:hypothetical protein
MWSRRSSGATSPTTGRRRRDCHHGSGVTPFRYGDVMTDGGTSWTPSETHVIRRYPRNPLRCPRCFRIVGASRHGVIGWHKDQAGRRCSGIGCYGTTVNKEKGQWEQT